LFFSRNKIAGKFIACPLSIFIMSYC
jgi:hypothetical protein